MVNSSANPTTKKKTRGRQKIELKKIDNKKHLQVTFTKRRKGLFKKANELGIVCGAEIAILVLSPANKIFAFGNPSVDSLLDKFQNHSGGTTEDCSGERELEETKNLWWDQEIEGMSVQELEEYVEALEDLMKVVVERADETEKARQNGGFVSTNSVATSLGCNTDVASPGSVIFENDPSLLPCFVTADDVLEVVSPDTVVYQSDSFMSDDLFHKESFMLPDLVTADNVADDSFVTPDFVTFSDYEAVKDIWACSYWNNF